MTAEIRVFTYTDQTVRTVVIDDAPWFVAADVTAVLGYGGGARNAVARLPERMKGVADVNTPGGAQRMTVISEPGTYRLVMRSNLAEAERFQDWLAEEVVPAIRKTGRYEAAPAIPQSFAEALQLAADQARQIEAQAAQLAVAAPKAEAWDVLAGAEGDYSVREAAFVLNRDPSISTGQNRLFKLLREWRLIDRNDIPFADHARHVQLRAQTYWHERDQEYKTTNQVRVTADGLRYLHRRLGGTAALSHLTPLDGAA